MVVYQENHRHTTLSVAIVACLSAIQLFNTVHSFHISPFPITIQNHARSPKPSWRSTIAPTSTLVTKSTTDRTTVSTTRCYGSRKRGRLNQNVSPTPKGGKNEVAVSSSLAEWAASAQSSSSATTPTTTPQSSISAKDYEDEGDNIASTFTPFSSTNQPKGKNKKNKTTPSTRRERQAQRQQTDSKRRSALISQTNTLRELLNGQQQLDISTILDTIQQIIREFGPGDDPKDRMAVTKRFFKSKASASLDYTLAWVGSDDAICHVGTGLHKVPLARLQDIFLTVGKVGVTNNAWRMMEVIRILGPFPNVRNTLLGSVMDVSKGTGAGATGIRIRYDSIVDGVGKELNAGTEEDTRFVDLDVFYADEEMIVCVVPNDGDGGGGDGNGALDVVGGGSSVLLFLREEDLEEKLEVARVAG